MQKKVIDNWKIFPGPDGTSYVFGDICNRRMWRSSGIIGVGRGRVQVETRTVYFLGVKSNGPWEYCLSKERPRLYTVLVKYGICVPDPEYNFY